MAPTPPIADPVRRKRRAGPTATSPDGTVKTWEFHAADGTPAFTVAQAGSNGSSRFISNPRTPPTPRPLFNLPALTEPGQFEVLLFDSLPAMDAAAGLVASNVRLTAIYGAPSDTDFSPLKGRAVAVCADAPSPLLDALKAIDAHSVAVRMPAADAPPDALQTAIANAVTRALAASGRSAVDTLAGKGNVINLPLNARDGSAGHAQTDTRGNAMGQPLPADLSISEQNPYFTCLGFRADGGREVHSFIVLGTDHIISHDTRLLRSEDGLRDLAPLDHWRLNYSGRDGDGRIRWKDAGDAVIARGREAGIFDESRIRGRGVWLDGAQDSDIVAHVGHELWVNGTPTRPSEYRGRYLYPLAKSLFPDSGAGPLTADEGKKFYHLARMLKWDNPKCDPDLFIGAVATGLICGAVKFRTHAAITGPSGAGKSWVLSLAALAQDHFTINALGGTTEAGIRQQLYLDARPCVCDEAEGKGKPGQARREGIRFLMRCASSNTKAKIFKGSGTHRGVEFTVNSQFINGSIGLGQREAADDSRTVILTLRKDTASTPADKARQETHFSECTRMMNELPPNFSERLFKRMYGRAKQINTTAELIRQRIALKFANSRVGDKYATIIAGYWAVVSDAPPSVEAIDRYISAPGKFDWSGAVASASEPEHTKLMEHLCSKVIRCLDTRVVNSDFTVGELALAATSISKPVPHMDKPTALAILRRTGIAYWEIKTSNPPAPGFALSVNNSSLTALFKDSDWPDDFRDILARTPGAAKTNAIWFLSKAEGAEAHQRAIWIPLARWGLKSLTDEGRKEAEAAEAAEAATNNSETT